MSAPMDLLAVDLGIAPADAARLWVADMSDALGHAPTGDDIRAGIGALRAIVSELAALAGEADLAAMRAAWAAEEARSLPLIPEGP